MNSMYYSIFDTKLGTCGIIFRSVEDAVGWLEVKLDHEI